MSIVTDVESLCKQMKISNIPALTQLKLARERNDVKTMNRIAENIISLINEMQNQKEKPDDA